MARAYRASQIMFRSIPLRGDDAGLSQGRNEVFG